MLIAPVFTNMILPMYCLHTHSISDPAFSRLDLCTPFMNRPVYKNTGTVLLCTDAKGWYLRKPYEVSESIRHKLHLEQIISEQSI